MDFAALWKYITYYKLVILTAFSDKKEVFKHMILQWNIHTQIIVTVLFVPQTEQGIISQGEPYYHFIGEDGFEHWLSCFY